MTPDVAHAVSLARKVRLRTVQCIGLQARMLSPQAPKNLDYELALVHVTWIRSDDMVVAILPFALTIVSFEKEGEARVRLAELSVSLQLEYEMDPSTAESAWSEIPHFIGITGYMHAWPYFRSDVQYLTAKLGFPALTLPIVVSGEVPSRVSVDAAPVVGPPRKSKAPKDKAVKGSRASSKRNAKASA